LDNDQNPTAHPEINLGGDRINTCHPVKAGQNSTLLLSTNHFCNFHLKSYHSRGIHFGRRMSTLTWPTTQQWKDIEKEVRNKQLKMVRLAENDNPLVTFAEQALQ